MNLDLRLSPLNYQAHHREEHILPEDQRMDLKFQLLAEVPLDPKEQSELWLVLAQKLPELQACSMQLWSNYRHRHNRLTLQRQSRCRKPIL